MKKLMLMFACTLFMTATSFAQSKTSTEKTATKKHAVVYVCPKCGTTSDKSGECMKCHVKMLKEGTYYCPMCGATSNKAGECKKCHKPMVKVAAGMKDMSMSDKKTM